MRFFRLFFAVAACAAGALTAPAAGATEFSGSCVVQGVVSFDESFGFAPEVRSHVYRGTGTCSGTLDGTRINVAPVAHEVDFPTGVNSCTANAGSDGRGRTVFYPGTGRRKVLEFSQITPGFASFEAVIIRGGDEGLALGLLVLPPSFEAGEDCETGSMREAAQALAFSTVTTLRG